MNLKTQESRKQELENLMQNQEILKSSPLQWCCTNYASCSTYWKTDNKGGMGAFAGEADAHPCVSFTMNLNRDKHVKPNNTVYPSLQETGYGME
ncbi:V-type proton ATPase subunit C-like [Primulina tabacum]|uniref:V-type proton ATPase subunit C-like n=1 Tax=Primulina tabacum TaxID=48773 RepID=UPI003F5A832B